MDICKHCGGDKCVKNGFVSGKQRYLCTVCKRTFRDGDNRYKYSTEKHLRVLKLYLDGVGIRSIERLEGVHASLIVHWMRKSGKIASQLISKAEPPTDMRDIQIIELDELYSFCKKRGVKSMFGWLSIGSETRWWILK